MNRLSFGDNLGWLRNTKEFPDASVDLVYLEARDAGRYTSKLRHDKDYPRLQILTIEGLLRGTERIDAPPQLNPFAMAARESTPHEQTEMTIPSQG